jgi:acetoin utilization deacetylase AcuC-like enzyme
MRAVYSDAMVAPAQGGSPSAGKPAAVMAEWRERWPDLVVRPANPVSMAQLSLAHDPVYVEEVLRLRLPNGFGTFSAEVAASLPYTGGAMLTAARWAMEVNRAVAALVSIRKYALIADQAPPRG